MPEGTDAIPDRERSLFARDDEAERHDRLMYHVASGDYFSVVATTIGFLEESLKNHCNEDTELEAEEVILARKLREDLQYLNKNYRITPKES